MTDKPLLPRGFLTGERTNARASARLLIDRTTGKRLLFQDNVSARADVVFPIDWRAVQEVAGVTVELSEIDRANVESAALRYRLELDRERAGDKISFGKLRGQAGKITAAAEKLRGLLTESDKPSLIAADLDTLQDLQRAAENIANSDTGGRGSPAYSLDLRKTLLRVLAGRWCDAGGEVRSAAFYRVGAEVITQVDLYAVTDQSLEQDVRRFIEGKDKV